MVNISWAGYKFGGKYILLGEAGEGAMGTIYKVCDSEGNPYALKRCYNKYKDLLTNEGHNLALLNDRNTPHIPRFVEIFEDGGLYHMVISYIDGITVETYLGSVGRVNEQTALEWGHAISRTLTFMHTIDPIILHRDIKPANIMITADGRVYLIDFGVSRNYEHEEIFMGTKLYAPPEQFRLGSGTTPRSDVYALGATLFEAVAGDLHPRGLSLSDIRDHIKSRRPSLSDAMIDVISRSIQDDQKLRPSSTEVYEAFEDMKKPRKIISTSPPSIKPKGQSILFVI